MVSLCAGGRRDAIAELIDKRRMGRTFCLDTCPDIRQEERDRKSKFTRNTSNKLKSIEAEVFVGGKG